MPITDATREEARRLARRYPVARSALLPMLHLVQSVEGYVSDEGVAMCADVLGLTKAEVGAVSTFYTMFKREPVGEYLLSVCTNPTCKNAGGKAIYDSYVDACGGRHHDPDGSGVTVEQAECLGICDAAPVVQINYEMFGPVTHDEAMDMFSKAKAGDPPVSNRSGEVPPTFSGVERELSGIDDGVDEYLSEAARLQTMSAVPPSYRTGETDIPVTHPGGDPAGHGGEVFRSSAQLHDGAGTSQGTPPEQQADLRGDEVVEEVARQGSDVPADLAEQVTGEPAGATPSVGDQPSTSGGATPDEATAPDDASDDVNDDASDDEQEG